MATVRREDVKRYGPAVATVAGVGLILWIARRPDPFLPGHLDVPVMTEPPTLTKQHARSLADGIYACLYGDGSFLNGSWFEDEAGVTALLTMAANDADVAMIIDAYGIRSGHWLISGAELNLPQAIRKFFNASQLLTLNAALTNKGIQWQF